MCMFKVNIYPSWFLLCYFGRHWRSGPCLSWPVVSHWPSQCLLYPFPSCRSLSFHWEHPLCRSANGKTLQLGAKGDFLYECSNIWVQRLYPFCQAQFLKQCGAQHFVYLSVKLHMCVFAVMFTVSIPNAFIWSALFSAMVKNFFGSDRASTIAETHKTIC